ncbi:MAG: hypothetical protein FWC28_05150 [Proteobacteria bacterium]|nr:hypothetical protein [Cystobacterineae bacterium]MCL2259021.1 hypothetical protein [Cystobacterineae bacterium]MCL2314625.1 hypothetical protein [Pseudomonadota bacterium]
MSQQGRAKLENSPPSTSPAAKQNKIFAKIPKRQHLQMKANAKRQTPNAKQQNKATNKK